LWEKPATWKKQIFSFFCLATCRQPLATLVCTATRENQQSCSTPQKMWMLWVNLKQQKCSKLKGFQTPSIQHVAGLIKNNLQPAHVAGHLAREIDCMHLTEVDC